MTTILALLVSLIAAVLSPAAQNSATSQPARAAASSHRRRQPGRVITAPSRPRRVLRPSAVLASRTLHAFLLGAALLGSGLGGVGQGQEHAGISARSAQAAGQVTARVSGRPGLERVSAPSADAGAFWS